MKKDILLGDGSLKQMSFEEVLHQYEPMIEKTARDVLKKMYYNTHLLEKDDLVQELKISTWEAYNKYDVSLGYSFTTYLYYRLKLGINRSTSKLYTKKRKEGREKTISLDSYIESNDNTDELSSLIGTEDSNYSNIELKDFITFLSNKLTSNEKKLLRILINKKEFTVQQYANECKISRVAAGKRLNNFKNKLYKLMKDFQYIHY